MRMMMMPFHYRYPVQFECVTFVLGQMTNAIILGWHLGVGVGVGVVWHDMAFGIWQRAGGGGGGGKKNKLLLITLIICS